MSSTAKRSRRIARTRSTKSTRDRFRDVNALEARRFAQQNIEIQPWTPQGERPPPSIAGLPQLARLPAVVAAVGLSASTIWRLRRRGAFPAPVQIGPNSVAWRVPDIAAWIETRPKA
jgi:prophage regulatory protein